MVRISLTATQFASVFGASGPGGGLYVTDPNGDVKKAVCAGAFFGVNIGTEDVLMVFAPPLAIATYSATFTSAQQVLDIE